MEIETEIRLENLVLGQAINQPEDFNILEQYVPNGDVFVQSKARRLWEIVSGILYSRCNYISSMCHRDK